MIELLVIMLGLAFWLFGDAIVQVGGNTDEGRRALDNIGKTIDEAARDNSESARRWWSIYP